MSGKITTVTGDIPSHALGVTLMHEHVLHQIWVASGKSDNVCVDREMMVEELLRFKTAGGGTVCDVTPLGLGRDPAGLRQVSEQSGVAIVSGIGLYTAETLPEEIKRLSRCQLVEYLVELAEGDSMGIPAGMIGEVASHNEDHADWQKYQLTEQETEIFQAVGEAQRRTGLCVSTHASLGRGGVAQVRMLMQGGASPERIIVGHCDAQWHQDLERDMDYYHRLLDAGVRVSFDLFGWQTLMPDAMRYRRIAALVAEGYADRIVISTDTCRQSQLHRFGGRGFDYLFASVIPGLAESDAAMDAVAIHKITVTNPARMLSRVN